MAAIDVYFYFSCDSEGHDDSITLKTHCTHEQIIVLIDVINQFEPHTTTYILMP